MLVVNNVGDKYPLKKITKLNKWSLYLSKYNTLITINFKVQVIRKYESIKL